MPSTDFALASSSNESLAQLTTRCIQSPACFYHMSKQMTRSRVEQMLQKSSPPRHRIPIWVWLNYPHGHPPQYIRLNLKALARHAPLEHFQLVVLNTSTLGAWLTLPDEFTRLAHQVAVSDLARLGLLARYGGLYVDADVLVTSTLVPLLKLLDEFETIAYTTPGQDCRAGVFSSNFLATRPNATLWAGAWSSIVGQLRNKCGGKRRHRVCCYAQNGTVLPTCRTPWGLTDWVMRPIAMSLAAENQLSVHCLGHHDGLTPMAFAHPMHFTVAEAACVSWLHIYSNPLRVGAGVSTNLAKNSKLHEGSPSHAVSNTGASTVWSCGLCESHHPREGPNSTLCCRRRANTLECRNDKGHVAKAGNFFGRWAYHLFESVNGATFQQHEPIESSDLAVAALYRRALGLPWH